MSIEGLPVKVVPPVIKYNTMKVDGGVGGATTFLTLAPHGREWSGSQPVALPTYPLDRKLCSPQSHSGHFTDENNFLPLMEIAIKFITVQPAA